MIILQVSPTRTICCSDYTADGRDLSVPSSERCPQYTQRATHRQCVEISCGPKFGAEFNLVGFGGGLCVSPLSNLLYDFTWYSQRTVHVLII